MAKTFIVLRYDKKLRDKIYIYLATLEEYVRAYISNMYEDNPQQTFWTARAKNRKGINDRILSGEKISSILGSLVFSDLMEQVKQLLQKDKDALFPEVPELIKNLDAVRILRNAVSHH